jgi:hypothetical protein
MPGWPQLRAVLITCALLLGFIAGWPELGPRAEGQLSPRGAALARRVPELRQRLLRPFAPLAGAFGIYTQNWTLFRGSGGTRHRMRIEARTRAGDWRIVYRVHDDEHAELRSAIESRRVFNLWNAHRWGTSPAYPAFVRWVARRVCREHPQLEEVRASQEQIEIQEGGRGFASTGRFDHVIDVSCSEVPP